MKTYNFRPTFDSDTWMPDFEYLKDVQKWLTDNKIIHTLDKTTNLINYEPLLTLRINNDKDATAFILRWGEIVNEYT